MSWIYALDIGTRKVAGLVGRFQGDKVEVVAVEVREHERRAMVDGQVHDVPAVAQKVREVTAELERRLGEPLREAALAVAGRALKTASASAAVALDPSRPLAADDVRCLEHEALRKVFRTHGASFQCVGYAAVRHRLDGQEIRNLEGQTGGSAESEVIATFLPRGVLEALLAAAARAGLKASSVTLEPVAALEAVVPPDLRLLDLALVDVGAGTSDIALVRGGAVCAFDMVPQAGDEITEALCRTFLLDFRAGEDLKRRLGDGTVESLEVVDLFGHRHILSRAEAAAACREAVGALSRAVADRILERLGGAPDAVVLVGGGSATVGLADRLCADLNLESRRIGVRRASSSPDLVDSTGRLGEAWGATPAGILLSAARRRGLSVRHLALNGVHRTLLYAGEPPTVGEALEQLGLEAPGAVPPDGRSRTLTVDGTLVRIPGGRGLAAEVCVNGTPARSDGLLPEGAHVAYRPPTPGADARPRLEELPGGSKPVDCFLNGMPLRIVPRYFMDGREADGREEALEGARVERRLPRTFREILESQGFELSGGESRRILVSLNGEPVFLTQRNYRLTAGGREVDFDYVVQEGDVLEFARDAPSRYRIRDVVPLPKDGKSLTLTVNGEPVTLPGGKGKVFLNGNLVDPDEFLIDHAVVVTRDGEDAVGLVSHVLAALGRPEPTAPGQRLRLEVNGEPAGFNTEVPPGSRLILRFE